MKFVHFRRVFLLACVNVSASIAAEKPHVLMIAVDDLRTDLGCYGNEEVITPHIDRLAAEGMVFQRAYCQQSLCGPSRISLMTSVYPDGLGLWGMSGGKMIEWRETRKGISSLTEHFRDHGYKAVGLGKIYDFRLGNDLAYSWDQYDAANKPEYAEPDGPDKKIKQSGRPKYKKAIERADVEDEVYGDGNITRLALETLEEHDLSEPLFLAVGFRKPHLPFVAPKKYWDLYDRSALSYSERRTPPEGFTKYLFSWYKEINDYDVPDPVTPEFELELIHGYYACVSYIDAQVGKIVQGLKDKGIYEDTVIVFWSDHGYKLGHFGEWAKHTNLETDARVPLIFKAAGQVATGDTNALVELVDVFPSLADLAGLPIPEHVEGKSLKPVFENPKAHVRDYAFTQYPMVQGTMSYSIRTKYWRYIETRHDTTGDFIAGELYDLKRGLIEQRNVFAKKPKVAREHSALLDEHLESNSTWTGGDTISSWIGDALRVY